MATGVPFSVAISTDAAGVAAGPQGEGVLQDRLHGGGPGGCLQRQARPGVQPGGQRGDVRPPPGAACRRAAREAGMPPTADPGRTRRSAHRASGAVCETAHPNSGKGPDRRGRCPAGAPYGGATASAGSQTGRSTGTVRRRHPCIRSAARPLKTAERSAGNCSTPAAPRWGERGTAPVGSYEDLTKAETPAASPLDERTGNPLRARRLVRETWPGRDAGGSPRDERGKPRSSARTKTWPGRVAGGSRWTNGETRALDLAKAGTPAAPRWTKRGTGPEVSGRQLGEGFRGAAAWRQPPAEPGGTFLVPFYRELRGMGLKARISGTSSAKHDVAFGQLPTSPWMPGARQIAVVK